MVRGSGGNDDARADERTSTRALADLLGDCAAGDEGAFDEVYAATAPRVFGLVLRVIVQHAVAEEITQEVFAYVWTDAVRYERSRGSAVGWILTIAHRRAVDRVRSISASRTRDDVWTRKIQAGSFDTTAEAANSSVEGAHVRRALAGLTLKQRTAIQLAYFQGLTYPEVAAQLGIPNATAKTRIRDGLRSLASALDHGVARA